MDYLAAIEKEDEKLTEILIEMEEKYADYPTMWRVVENVRSTLEKEMPTKAIESASVDGVGYLARVRKRIVLSCVKKEVCKLRREVRILNVLTAVVTAVPTICGGTIALWLSMPGYLVAGMAASIVLAVSIYDMQVDANVTNKRKVKVVTDNAKQLMEEVL